jgi:nucleoside-diphosphate-sugar epimerase
MAVVILGAAGYVGSAIRRINPFRDPEVLTMDIVPADRNGVPIDIVVQPSWDSSQDLQGLGVPRGSTVVSLAGSGDSYWCNQQPLEAISANTRMAIASVHLAAAISSPRLVLASSTEVYGFPGLTESDESSPCRPATAYGVAKYAAECIAFSMAATRDVRIVVARLGSAFGPEVRERGLFVRIRDSLRSGEPMTVYGHPQFRQFTSLNDIARAVDVICSAAQVIPPILNVCSPKTTQIGMLIRFAVEELGMPEPEFGDGIPEPDPVYVSSTLLHTTFGVECGESLLPWLREFCLAEES